MVVVADGRRGRCSLFPAFQPMVHCSYEWTQRKKQFTGGSDSGLDGRVPELGERLNGAKKGMKHFRGNNISPGAAVMPSSYAAIWNQHHKSHYYLMLSASPDIVALSVWTALPKPERGFRVATREIGPA